MNLNDRVNLILEKEFGKVVDINFNSESKKD